MKFKFRSLLSILMLVLLVVGCNTAPPKQEITCDALRQSELRAFIRTDPTQAQFIEWVKTEYQTDAVESGESDRYPDATMITWEIEGRRQSATFNEQTLQFVQSDLDATSATIASTIDCFGEPSSYSARMFSGFEGRKIDVNTWYPESGIKILFKHEGYAQDRETLRSNYPAYSIAYLPTSTLDEGFNRVYQFHSEGLRAEWYALIKPYPDDIESVEVTIEP